MYTVAKLTDLWAQRFKRGIHSDRLHSKPDGEEGRSRRISSGRVWSPWHGLYLLAERESAFLSTLQVPKHWSLSGLGSWGFCWRDALSPFH